MVTVGRIDVCVDCVRITAPSRKEDITIYVAGQSMTISQVQFHQLCSAISGYVRIKGHVNG